MFANAIHALASSGLGINWFDVVVMLMLSFGIFRGRKNGMSKELLPTLQWLAVIFVCGSFYSLLAVLLARFSSTDRLTSYLVAYVMLALIVFFIFSLLKRTVGLKLFGSNLFGNAEYYLGMPSGMVRFGCMLLFALALLNARNYTSAQIDAASHYQVRWFGTHMFPNLYSVQTQVFKKSFTGPYVKDYLGVLLIKPTTEGGHGQLAQNGPDD